MNQITGATKAYTWGCRHVTPSVLFYTCVVQKSMAGYNIRDLHLLLKYPTLTIAKHKEKKKKRYEID